MKNTITAYALYEVEADEIVRRFEEGIDLPEPLFRTLSIDDINEALMHGYSVEEFQADPETYDFVSGSNIWTAEDWDKEHPAIDPEEIVGKTYSDPEGNYIVTGIFGSWCDVKNVTTQKEFCVPLKEVLHFIEASANNDYYRELLGLPGFYYVIDDSPLEGYGEATRYDSMEDAAGVVEDHLPAFHTTPTICEYDSDDEFTGRFWEYIDGDWKEGEPR